MFWLRHQEHCCTPWHLRLLRVLLEVVSVSWRLQKGWTRWPIEVRSNNRLAEPLRIWQTAIQAAIPPQMKPSAVDNGRPLIGEGVEVIEPRKWRRLSHPPPKQFPFWFVVAFWPIIPVSLGLIFMPTWFSGYIIVFVSLCKPQFESSIPCCVFCRLRWDTILMATACKNCLWLWKILFGYCSCFSAFPWHPLLCNFPLEAVAEHCPLKFAESALHCIVPFPEIILRSESYILSIFTIF